MMKRRRFSFSPRLPRLGLRGLSFYGHWGVWQDALTHAGILKFGNLAREVAFLWLLGTLAGSFALLQWQQQYGNLPPVSLSLGQLVQAILIPAQSGQSAAIGRFWIGAMALLAWFCLVAGTSRLARLVSQIYHSSLTRRPRWLTVLGHWLLTAMALAMVNLVLHWVGPALLSGAAAEELKLAAAEGSIVAPTWQSNLWHLVRWPLSLGLVVAGLTVFYRLSPQRWSRGAPLWAGAGLAVAIGFAGIGVGFWAMLQLLRQAPAYGSLFSATIALMQLLGLAWLILFGAQFNVSLVNQGTVSVATVHSPPMVAPPPSFEAFKINRSLGDRFPRQ